MFGNFLRFLKMTLFVQKPHDWLHSFVWNNFKGFMEKSDALRDARDLKWLDENTKIMYAVYKAVMTGDGDVVTIDRAVQDPDGTRYIFTATIENALPKRKKVERWRNN